MEKDPHELGKRLKAFSKNRIEENFFSSLNHILVNADIERPQVENKALSLPLIYIVGAPRSGTTLLYQLLCRHLPVGYINNLIARFWLRPSVGIMLSEALLKDKTCQEIELDSIYGTTKGVAGPHEFGYFWRHWLKFDESPTHHLTEEALSRVDVVGLKHALEHEILGSFSRPVVFKNVNCGFHAAFLTEVHPASLFIHITRDPIVTALSILNSRMQRFGTYSVWWSLKPSTYPFDLPPGDPAAEVVMQVIECHREINEELSRTGVNSTTISYEELCKETGLVIKRILENLRKMGLCDIEPKNYDFPHLSVSREDKLPSELENRVRQCVAEFIMER